MKRVLAFASVDLARGRGDGLCRLRTVKWPLAREKTWFAQTPKPVEAGAEIALADQAFQVALKPNDAAGYLCL